MKHIASGMVGAGVFGVMLLGWTAINHTAPASYSSLADSVVRVEKGKAFGSGVIVAPDLIITAGHVAGATVNGVVELRDGRVFAIAKVLISPKYDIGLITLANPIPGAKVATISSAPLHEDMPILAIGHPMNSLWTASRFLVMGQIQGERPAGTVMVQGAPPPGLSGGPAFNEAGKAVGIMTTRMLEPAPVPIPLGIGTILPFSALKADPKDLVSQALGW